MMGYTTTTTQRGFLVALLCFSAVIFVDGFASPPTRSHVPLRSTKALQMAGANSEAASQNIFGVASDAITGAAFSLLHAFDDCGIQDSSKNLRVLWVRALLNQKGRINDEIASLLLPPTTKGLVTTPGGASLFDPILQFTEWVEARTEFIDKGLDLFLESPVCQDSECNVVLFGAGYDTRALRYRHCHNHKINFMEVDLPSVVEGKGKLYQKFQQDHDPEWNLSKDGSTLIPFDLNDCGGDLPISLVETLRKNGLKKNVPTFFVWEAVLFYVNEDAVRNIMKDLFEFAQPGGNGDSPNAETMICFTGAYVDLFCDCLFCLTTIATIVDQKVIPFPHLLRFVVVSVVVVVCVVCPSLYPFSPKKIP